MCKFTSNCVDGCASCKPVDWTKPIQLSDGRKARLVDKHFIPSIGCKPSKLLVIENPNSESTLFTNEDGTVPYNGSLRVINTPRPKKKIEVVTYIYESIIKQRTREDFEKYGRPSPQTRILKTEVFEIEE